MSLTARPTAVVAGASGCLSGALLLSGEPFWALVCGGVALASGALRTLGREAAPPDSVSLWDGAGRCWPAGRRRWRERRAKFLLRALGRRSETRAWLSRLARPDAAPLWRVRPRLAQKLQRPYLRCHWTTGTRLEVLRSHYDLLRDLFSADARAGIYSEGVKLVRLGTASGRLLDLKLLYRDQFEKEGELTIAIEDAETTLLLASLTFCLTEGAEGRTAWIGGLQASPDSRTRELIQAVTKEVHGLRPKALALWALRQLCVPWQIARIRAVADGRHVSRSWRKRKTLHACYDEFWVESGAVRAPDGEWDLPVSAPERPRRDLKPSRRKAHELRYAMLAELRADLLAANASIALEADPAESSSLPRLFAVYGRRTRADSP